MATTPLNFFTGPESNINSLAKKQGQVIFAINGDETSGNIYQDISNTKRIKIGKNAETAQKDANGNVITDTYETKSDASAKLVEAKAYTDTEAAKKADSTHIHAISDVTNLQDSLDSHDIAIDELNEEVSIDYSQIAFDTGSEYEDGGIDFSVYQTKADGTLSTTAKTVSGAINELNSGIANEASLRTEADTALDAKISQISNPNLLINSDFRNPINQRGSSSYNITAGWLTMTIDRWTASDHQTVYVEDGYLRTAINQDHMACLMIQKIEMNPDQIPDVMTLSARIRASQAAKWHLYETGRTFDVGTDWTNVVITFTKEEIGGYIMDDYFMIFIGILTRDGNFPSGTYVDIEWAKLEAGSIATPFVPRPYAEELAICQRYYQNYNGEFNVMCANKYANDNNIDVVLPLLASLRTTPSIKYNNVYVAEGTHIGAWSSMTNISVLFMGNNVITLRLTSVSILNAGMGYYLIFPNNGCIELDAEIY